MKTGRQRLKNALAATGGVMLIVGCGLFQRLVLWPAIILVPSRRDAWVSRYMRWTAARVFDLIGLAGARFDFDTCVPSSQPTLVVMNHQSLLDIPAAILMCEPFYPLFVTRRKYGRFIPLVSPLLRIARAPLIDPERSPKEAIADLGDSARQLEHAMLIFPEGRRTDDGEIGRFHLGGVRAIIRERRVPVYLIITDGFWHCRTFIDVANTLRQVRARGVALGPFQPPADESELTSFIAGLRERMIGELHKLREAA